MTLTRNPKAIESSLYVKNGQIYTREKLIIEFPKLYENKDLFKIEHMVSVYGIFAMIIGNNYSVSVIPTMIVTNPLLINEIEKEDGVYIQMTYGKDSVVIENTTLIRNKLLSYNIFELYFMLGKFPWFLEYEDVLRVLDNLPRYAESNIGANFISNEILVSFIARLKASPMTFLRQSKIRERDKYFFVDLNDVYYSALSTVTKLGGNYFQESLVSALVQKEETPTKLENLVRR